MTQISELFNEFNSENINILDFIINLFLTSITAYLLSLIYSRYGASFSNRKKLAQTLILISITTMIIISIVKSSLALSLGLVGALSIVRFRTAIKEPEELAYFFISISIGLGFGADQRIVTVLGVLFVLLVIIIISKLNKTNNTQQNLVLSIVGDISSVNEFQIISTLKEDCTYVDIKRIDQTNELYELALDVEFKNVENLMASKAKIAKLGNIQFSFIERH
jgi:hypothetical protein